LVAHLHFLPSHKPTIKNAKELPSNRTKTDRQRTDQQRQKKNNEGITRVWQKWRFSAPQAHLWLIKHWFSASTFVVKIATFAKPETGSEPKKRNQCFLVKDLHFTTRENIGAIISISPLVLATSFSSRVCGKTFEDFV